MSSQWIDFQSVKQSVSMELVLAHYGITLRRVNQNALRGKCPLPTHDPKKGEPSFSVNLSKNAWACLSQSCIKARNGKRGGNQLDLVSWMEGGCTVREAALKLANWFNVSSDGGDASLPKNDARHGSATELASEKKTERGVTDVVVSGGLQNKPLAFVLKSIDHSHAYLTSRGITPKTAEYFEIGFFGGKGSMHGRIVIPIHNSAGELVAYAGRAIDESEPRYKLPGGFLKTLELFNQYRVLSDIMAREEAVIVVEGFFGCMKIHQAGYPRVLALMGSTLSEVQEKILAGFPRLVLMFDGDEAGRGATLEIATRLMSKTFVKVINLPDGKQPDQLSSEEIRFILGSL
jgi:DNA primase